jgi:hypothetical protein
MGTCQSHGSDGPEADILRRSKMARYSITPSAVASSLSEIAGPNADKLVLGWRLHRQIGWLLAFENVVDVAGCAPVLIDRVGPARGVIAKGINRRQSVAGSER